MTQHQRPTGSAAPWDDLLATDAVWAPVAAVEDVVVAAVTGSATDGPRAARRPAVLGALAGVAAAIALLLVAVALDVVRVDLPGGATPETVVVALAPLGEAPPDARGAAQLEDRADGLWMALQLDGLPPAPEGQWYEATVQPAGGPAVPAGSFHLRGGEGRVILWAGAALTSGLDLVVTRQPDDVPVLSGRLD